MLQQWKVNVKLESSTFVDISFSSLSSKEKKNRRKRRRKDSRYQCLSLVMISRVRLAVRVSVRIFPTGRAATGPSGGRHGSGPSVADGTRPSTAHNRPAVPAAVISGDIVMMTALARPKCLQTNKRGNGEGDERREDRLLCYEADAEVCESRQNSELHFRGNQKGYDAFQSFLLTSSWNI